MPGALWSCRCVKAVGDRRHKLHLEAGWSHPVVLSSFPQPDWEQEHPFLLCSTCCLLLFEQQCLVPSRHWAQGKAMVFLGLPWCFNQDLLWLTDLMVSLQGTGTRCLVLLGVSSPAHLILTFPCLKLTQNSSFEGQCLCHCRVCA